MGVYKDKKTKKWFVKQSWYDEQKVRHYITRRGFDTKRAAEKVENKIKTQIDEGINVVENPIFADYYDDWVKTYKGTPNGKSNTVAPNTLTEYLLQGKRIRNYFGSYKKLNLLKEQAIKNFINDFGKDHAKTTMRKLHNIIKACVRSAINDGIITRNFTDDISLAYNQDKAYKVTYLQDKDIPRLYNYLYEHRKLQYSSSYMLMLMLLTGLRESEVAGLTWDNINFQNNLITVEKAGFILKKIMDLTKKRALTENCECPVKMMDSIKELKNNHKTKVFWSKAHRCLPGSKGLTSVLRTALDNLNIKADGFHPHSLRHSQVALLLQADISTYDIAQRLGHATTKTTEETYAYEFEKHRELVNQKINDALSKKIEN
ncbi:integrase [Lactobacillus phage KC5a]|uniref:integrase n=1 Tax=Lactobacillus phage KC5a TaxID=363555 RepID=UPI00006DE02F|nr:integrase [Lactobacillus phage KC5a]ABD78778.1 integrase [Lactobacillus phage KC5a]